jgi:lysophospholipase L1-like esterase
MNAFARALAALHRDPNLSVACTWTAAPEWLPLGSISLRGIESQPAERAFGDGGLGAITGRRFLDVAVADVPGRVRRGDTITIGADVLTVEVAELDIEGITWRLTLAAGPEASLPETLRAVFLGDSVTDYMSSVTVGSDGYPSIAYMYRGYGTWMAGLTGGRLVYDQNDDLGNAGDRSDQILVRLPAAIARAPDVLFAHIGHNDITQLNSFYGGDQVALRAALLAAYQSVVAAANDAGITPVVLPIWAHSNWSLQAQFDVCAAHVAELEAWCAANAAVFIDSYLADLIDPDTGAIRTDLSDGVHPNSEGAYLFAKPIASWLGARLETLRHKMTVLGEPILTDRTDLEGDGGDLTGFPFGGVLATGWDAYGTSTDEFTAGTVTFSKAARADGFVEQVITWAGAVGPSTGTKHGFTFRVEAPDIEPGEIVILTCLARIENPTAGLKGPWAMLYEYNGTTPRFGELRGMTGMPADVFAGAEFTIRTPPLTIRPNMGASYLDVRLGAEVDESAGISGSLAIWGVELLRLPAPPAPPPPDPVDVQWSLDADYGGISTLIEWTLTAEYGTGSYDLNAVPRVPGAYALN